MTIYKQPLQLGDLLLVEVAPGWTREKLILLAGDAIPMGTVLVRDDKGICQPPAVDPASKEAAYAVLAEDAPASAGPRRAVGIARGATLNADHVIWPTGLPDARKLALVTSLDVRGLVLRSTL